MRGLNLEWYEQYRFDLEAKYINTENANTNLEHKLNTRPRKYNRSPSNQVLNHPNHRSRSNCSNPSLEFMTVL